jgi:hypothetical protein
MKTQYVTPKQFTTICVALLELEAQGHDPETCTRLAFNRARVVVPKGEDVEIAIRRDKL